jgi:hypothetical protein
MAFGTGVFYVCDSKAKAPKINMNEMNNIRIFAVNNIRTMLTKLTLSVEQSVIKSAKAYAKQKGKSVSELVEHYLRSLKSKASETPSVSPQVLAQMGAVKLPKTSNYKQALSEALSKQYQP